MDCYKPPNYPDIAGIGIISAFIANSLFTLGFAFASLFLSRDIDPYQNALDTFIDRKIRAAKWLGITERKRQIWSPVIETIVLSLGNQQLVIGLAMLIAGFIRHASISVYHFSIVGNLAWIASSSHFTTLTVLGRYLQHHHVLRDVKVVLIALQGVLLLANSVLAGHEDWFDSGRFPAQCLFDDFVGHVGGSPALWMAIDIASIGIFYPLTILSVYKRPYLFLALWLYEKPLAFMDGCIHTLEAGMGSGASALVRYWSALLVLGLLMARWVFIVAALLSGSIWIDLLGDFAWLLYGFWSLSSSRDISPSEMHGNENEMTFGQIVPILLLSLTALAMNEAYDESLKIFKEAAAASVPDCGASLKSSPSNLSTQTLEMRGGLSHDDSDSGSQEEPLPPQRVDTEAGNRTGVNASGSQHLDISLSSPRNESSQRRELME